MQLFGNILLGLASLITLLPLPLLVAESRRARNDGSALWGAIFLFVPLWILLTLALSAATARGGLDWLPVRRGALHALVLAAGVALVVTSVLAFLGRIEPASQMPVVSRPFLAWADVALPLAAIAFLLPALNPSLFPSAPPAIFRLPFAVLAGAALVHGVALIGEWRVRASQREIARAQEDADRYSKFERDMIERIRTLDAEKDIAELLDGAAHTTPEVREAALTRLRLHPHLRDGIASVLRSWRADAAFAYLDAFPASPEDKTALAQPVLDAIGELTRATIDEIERSSHFYDDQFFRRTRQMLAVIDAFADQRLDYLGAVRTYRRALDTGSAAQAHFHARATLDHWLAQHGAASFRR